MLSRLLPLLMMTAVFASQAIVGLAHVHGELAESSSAPHIHLSGHDHGHSHHDHHGHSHHGHHHHHGEELDSSVQGHERSAEPVSVPVTDLVFVANADVSLAPNAAGFQTESFVLNLSFGTTFDVLLLDSFVAKPPESRIALAHAPMLNKIRLLL